MPPNKTPTQGRWRGYALSILLHSGLVAAAVFGWFTWKHRAPDVDTLAIEGSVVDERVLKDIAAMPEAPPEKPPEPEPEPVPVPEPEPEPAPVEEQGPPAPDPAELQRKEEERIALEQKQKEEQEQKDAQELKKREEAERVEAEKQAAAKAAEEKAAAEKKAAEKKTEEAAAARKAAEEKARLARQAELNRAIEAEERGNAARNSDDAARWRAQIAAQIQRRWKLPPSAVPGVECIVTVTQVPGGDVTNVRGTKCNVDDVALRESLENAVMGASPLPDPPAGVPFERILELTFKPQ